MADTSIKFGVVTGAPSQLTAEKIEEGKLYFLAGEKNGNIKQGIYGVDSLTSDPSSGVFNLAMFGCGSVADGTGYGLSQYSFDNDASTKLKNLHDASSNYLLKTSYVQVSKSSDGYVPKAGAAAGTIDSQDADWVLTYNGTSVDWHKLPANAFKNDNSIYTGTSPISVSGTTISHANSGVTAGRYGDTSSARTLAFGDKFKVVDVSVDALGHVTKAASYELTLPSKPATAGTADVANEAKKTTGTLTIKGNGTSVGTFNGSVAEEVNIKSGSASTLTITGTADGSITITPVTGAVASNSSALTTGAQVALYVADVVGELTGALVYKGTVNGANGLPSNASTGWVYVASAGFTYNDGTNDWAVESGDMFIYNGSKWNIVNGENQVSNKNATLSIGSSTTIATVDGTDITVSLPSSGYYTHPASTSGTTAVSSSDGGDFAFSTTNKTIQVLTGVTRDASGHIGKVVYKDLTLPATAYSDTIYTHPASISGATLADTSLKSTTSTSLSHAGSFTVATGVYRDASGHISKVATETFKLPSQYSHPAAGAGSVDTPTNSSTAATLLTRVKIDSSGHVTDTTAFNGTVGGTTTPVYFNAGVPTALGYTIATSVPSGAIFTDKNVQDTSGTGKSFILGHATQGSTAAATTNASVYMQSGKMYATSGSVASNDTALVTGGVVYTAVEAAKEAATIYWETL